MPHIFRDGNDELDALREAPSVARLLAYFEARTREWPHAYIDQETFTVGIFYDLVQAFRHDGAFNLLGIAAQMPWDDLPDYQFLLWIDLLGELASASDTTEMPVALAQHWNTIALRAMSLGPSKTAWQSLVQHYRQDAS